MKIIEMISTDRSVTIPEMARKFGLTPRAIEKQIAKLKKENKIRRVGPAKGGYWEIVKD